MSHTPVNHHLRPLYRMLAALTGLYVLIFGIIGYARTGGTPTFSQDHLVWVLGLRTNLGFALASMVTGAIVLLSTLVGRNVDYWINMIASIGFFATGLAMLGLMQTDANVLGFSMANCIASFLFGMVLFAAALYGKTGSVAAAHAEEAFRHGGR